MGERLGQRGFGDLGSSYDSWSLWTVERRRGGDVCWPVLYVVLRGRWIESGFCLKTTNLGVGLEVVAGVCLERNRKGHGLEPGLDLGVGKGSGRRSERGLMLGGGE